MIKPLNGAVFLQLKEEESEGGIEVINSSTIREGVVLEIASDCEQDIEKGDVVSFDLNIAQPLDPTPENRYYLIHEKHLIFKNND